VRRVEKMHLAALKIQLNAIVIQCLICTILLIRPFLTDPDDELILELASASASSYIVTHNRDDFRDAGRFGVGVLTPGEFLRVL